MKVSDSIARLEDCDPDADVFIMSGEGYPFECAVQGVAERGDWLEDEDEDAPGPTHAELVAARRDRWIAPEANLPRTDVFLVEGSQLRYGSKRAWESVP